MSNTKYTCLVCKSNSTERFLECTDHFVSGEKFETRKCNSCGFVFTANPPEMSKMGTYYQSEEYISHSDTQEGLVNKLYHKVRDIMLKRKLKLVKKEAPGKVLLDIGCGTGYFPHFMKKNGFEAYGMELDADARKFAAENFNLKVDSPDDLLSQKIESKYDVITLWHVLEHLHDSEKYLNWIKNALKDDGALIIALPNCSSYDAKAYGKFWAAYDVPRHLWHFVPETFKPYLSQFGFKLKQVKRLPFDAFYNSLMSAKYAKKFSALIHGFIIGNISNLFGAFNAKRTSSVIYVLRKEHYK